MTEFWLGWCCCFLSWNLCDRRWKSAALTTLVIIYFGIAYISKGAAK